MGQFYGGAGSASDAAALPFQHYAVLLAAWACVSGCVGPAAIRHTRLRYNEVVRYTTAEQLLINIVRLRYADTTVFIDLPSITSQFQAQGGGSYLGGYGNEYPGPTSLGSGTLSLSDTPTLSYHPREGIEIAKALLTPLSADLFNVVNAGANVEQLLLLCMDDINDVPNAPAATTLIPAGPDDNSEFVRGVKLISSLRKRNVADLAFATIEETVEASDPIPKSAVTGRDVLAGRRGGLRLPHAAGRPGRGAQASEKRVPPNSRRVCRSRRAPAHLPPEQKYEQLLDRVRFD